MENLGPFMSILGQKYFDDEQSVILSYEKIGQRVFS